MVRVDPRDERAHVGEQLPPVARRLQEPDRARELLLGLRARLEAATGERERERVDSRNVERGDPSRRTEQLQQQAAVLGRDPAGTELDVGARAAVDVRDAPAVAHDAQTRARTSCPLGLAFDAEPR